MMMMTMTMTTTMTFKAAHAKHIAHVRKTPSIVVFYTLLLGTFRSEDEDDYEYEFSVLSTRIRFGGRHFSKYACSEQKTRTGSRPSPPI